METNGDRKSVLYLIAKDGNKTENRRQIDIYALLNPYSFGELEQIGWIPGAINPAEALTKIAKCSSTPLLTLITTNKPKFEQIVSASITTGLRASEKKMESMSNFVYSRHSLAQREDVEVQAKTGNIGTDGIVYQTDRTTKYSMIIIN